MSGRRVSGMQAWVLQRITAIYLALYITYMVGFFIFTPPPSHDAWQLWVVQPHVSMAMLLFFGSILFHAWVGIRNVLIDYIKPFGLRLTLLILVGLGLAACGVWSLEVVMSARIA